MEKESIISLLIILRFLTVGAVEREILNQVPIFSPSDALSQWKELATQSDCQKICNNVNAPSYVTIPKSASELTNNINCLCLKSSILGHGFIQLQGSLLHENLEGGHSLNRFLFMDVMPLQDAEMSPTSISLSNMRMTIETCALLCTNLKTSTEVCRAIRYNVIKQTCQLYQRSHVNDGGVMELRNHTSNSQLMYLELLGQQSSSFSRVWGLKIVDGSIAFSVTNVEQCALDCEKQMECRSFIYFPARRLCQLSNFTRKTGKLDQDQTAIYFEKMKTPDCTPSSENLITTEGQLKSPGWPGNFSSANCSWNFLTPWGKSMSVNLTQSSLPTKINGSCTVGLQLNKMSSICQEREETDDVTDDGVNILKIQNNDKSTTDKKKGRFIARYFTEWACVKSTGEPVVLQGPGQIASLNYPKPFTTAACHWIIKPPNSKKISIVVQEMNFTSPDMLESATLIFTDKNNKATVCDNSKPCQKLSFDGQVQIKFEPGFYFTNPKGFILNYTFDIGEYFPKQDKVVNEIINLNEALKTKEIQENKLEQYPSVDLNYRIITQMQGYKISLRIEYLSVGLKNGDNECLSGQMEVRDPDLNSIPYIFCQETTNQTVLTSQGPSLRVRITIPKRTHLPSAYPSQWFKIAIATIQPQTKDLAAIEDNANITSPRFPNNYSSNFEGIWNITSTNGFVPVLSFSVISLAEFRVISYTECDNDRLFINNGIETLTYCGHVPENRLPSFIVPHADNITVTMITDDRYEDLGFKARVEMWPRIICNPLGMISINSTGLISYFWNGRARNSSDTCSWILGGHYIITISKGCKGVSINHESQTNCNTELHLQEGTVISWRPTENENWFVALFKEKEIASTSIVPTTSPESSSSLSTTVSSLNDSSSTFALTTQFSNATLPTTMSQYNDSSVTTPQYNDSSITTPQYNDSSMTTHQYNDSTITTPQYNDSSVTRPQYNDSSVTTPQYNDSSMTTSQYNDSSITTSPYNQSFSTTSPYNESVTPTLPYNQSSTDFSSTPETQTINSSTESSFTETMTTELSTETGDMNVSTTAFSLLNVTTTENRENSSFKVNYTNPGRESHLLNSKPNAAGAIAGSIVAVIIVLVAIAIALFLLQRNGYIDLTQFFQSREKLLNDEEVAEATVNPMFEPETFDNPMTNGDYDRPLDTIKISGLENIPLEEC